MIIEWHTHVYPPEEAAGSAFWGGRCPMTVENVLAAHHQAGLAVSVVSNAAHYLRGKSQADELKAISRWDDYAAELQEAHKGTLYCLAMATPCGGSDLSQGARARDPAARPQGRADQLEP